MSILSSVKLSSVPELKAVSYRGIATIGSVDERELPSGKVQITLPLEYADEKGNDRTFNARVFVDPTWFEDGYVVKSTTSEDDDERREAFAYQMNFQKVLRKAAKFVGLDEIDLDQFEGKQIGIVLGPESDKRDPSRQELKSLYSAK